MYFPPRELLDRDIFPKIQVDKGAIRHILSGSHIMCPGLTSEGALIILRITFEGGKLIEGGEEGQFALVMAEGKTHALAIGRMVMCTDDM
jgi:PUA domain protein